MSDDARLESGFAGVIREPSQTGAVGSDQVSARLGTGPRRPLTRGPNGVISGVCAGIADCFGISLVFTRIVFVALTFVDGIGILIYLVLILIIPKGSRDYGLNATLPRTSSSNQTLFGYITGAFGICAAVFTSLDNLATIWNGIWPPDASSGSVFLGAPSGIHGSARAEWSSYGVVYHAEIGMSGSTGTIVVNYVDPVTSDNHSVRQEAVFGYDGQMVSLKGRYPSEIGYRPDTLWLLVDPGRTFVITKACDSAACYAVHSYSGTMQLEYN